MPETITIPVEEYKNLIEAFIRVKIFSEHVNSSKYSLGRDECGRFLSFEVKDVDDD